MEKNILKAAILACMVAACKGGSGGSGSSLNNSDPDDPPPEEPTEPKLESYPFDFDMETPGGIQIQTNNIFAPDVDQLDTWYEETQQCVADAFTTLGISGFEFFDGPPVVITEDLEDLCATETGWNAVYCANYETPFMGITQINAQFANNWKHEFIHHILFYNEFDEQMNLNHTPTEIWNCQN